MNNKANLQAGLDEFLYRADSLVSSKYLMIDKRISELLQSIAGSDLVFNIIAQCMVNFDFVAEWKYATTTDRLILPEGNEKQISFIFCMLNNIDDKNLDISKILEHYFCYDETRKPYQTFTEDIILLFKNLILNEIQKMISLHKKSQVSVSTEESQVERETQTDEDIGVDLTDEQNATTEELSESLIYLLKKLANIVVERKIKILLYSKEDLLSVISTFEIAVKKQESDYYYALLTTILSALKKAKDIRNILNEIDLIATELIKRK